jgi:hypothetical protein
LLLGGDASGRRGGNMGASEDGDDLLVGFM